MEFCKNQKDDLSYWEFINSSDAEDGKDRHDDDYDCEDSMYDGFGSWSSLSSIDDSTKEKSAENDVVVVVAMVEQVLEPPIKEDDHQEIGKNDDVVDAEEEEVYEDEDEDDDEDGDDMDFHDELVPLMVGDKLGKDRSRKLGKRSCAKWTRSKRISHRGLAYRF